MQIYQASSKENFLQELVNFTQEHFANEFSNLKIILPSGLLCSQLQNNFIENFQTSILPTIIPLAQVGTLKKQNPWLMRATRCLVTFWGYHKFE